MKVYKACTEDRIELKQSAVKEFKPITSNEEADAVI